MRLYPRYSLILILILLLVVVPRTPIASAESRSNSDEYKVKAAFLYNFAKFIEWPGDEAIHSDEPLTIGIYGKDPFGDYLDQISEKATVNGRKLAILRFEQFLDLQPCHILFISQSEDRPNLERTVDTLHRWNVLTISDIENFAQRGGIIQFETDENQIRFKINTDAARRAELIISSQLLKLASIVTDDREREYR
jgi:hypothetical protein